MKSYVFPWLAAVTLTTSTVALADGDHKAAYGGVVAVVADVQYELVAKPDALTVYILDHGKPVDTKGATGKLTLLAGANKSEVTLTPVGANALEAKGAFKTPPGTKAVATITVAGKPAASARFEIK